MIKTKVEQNEFFDNIISIFKAPEAALFMVIVALIIFLSLATDHFFTIFNITNIFKQASIIGIIAIGATIVIISGGIDLSVGAIAGFSAMILALILKNFEIPIWVAIGLAILSGTLIGLYNGIVIYETRIPSFIATLGSMIIIQGVTKLISDAKMISGLPSKFTNFAYSSFLGISSLVYVWVILSLISYFILYYTRFGRNIYTIGSSEEVAKLSGINLRLNIYFIYTLTGLICSIAGVLLTARLACAVPTGGQGYNLTAIAAAVIGGASLSGAQGSVLGTVLGTMLMVLITNGGIHLGLSPFVMEITAGMLITIAVVMDKIRTKKD